MLSNHVSNCNTFLSARESKCILGEQEDERHACTGAQKEAAARVQLCSMALYTLAHNNTLFKITFHGGGHDL